MEFSRVRYVGDGITRTFVVPFPYLKPEHVFVHVNLLPVEFEWVNPGVIQLSEPPENGAKVVIFRETPREIRFVEFVDGAFLKASDLDQAMIQIFYIAQEASDLSVSNYTDTVGAMATALQISTTYHSDMQTWLNQVQTLAEQVQTAVANLDAATAARLADAFKGANQSLANTGYQKLPGGLIIQWGTYSLAAKEGSKQAITFPVAFPTALIHPSVSTNNAAHQMIGTINRSLTGMTIVKGTGDGFARSGFWLAIGY